MPRISSLDGLRGIACLLVVFAHTAHVPSGGFIGVQLFFVLSGYLITSLLFKELAATTTINFCHFYTRRCVRLLPPFMVAYAVCLIMAMVWPKNFPYISPRNLPEILFLSNYNFTRNPFPPLLHVWSLSAEWQFYFVWPIMLFLFAKIWPKNGVVLACVAGFLFTFAGRFGYIPLDARGFMLGVLVVVLSREPRLRSYAASPYAFTAALFAIVAIFWLAFTQTPTPNMLAWGVDGVVALTALVVFVCSNADHPWLTPILSLPLLRYVGRISYGLYLYHFPLAWIMYDFHYTSLQMALVVIPLSILLADLSWRFVESPVLQWARGGVRRPATSVATANSVLATE